MRYPILIGLLAAVALPAWADLPLDVAEVIQGAQLVRDGHAIPLQMGQALKDGDAIKTGDWRSSVTLHFVRDGVLTLGRSSQLLIDGASPASLGRGEVLRAQLVSGELTLDAYPAHNTVPKDYRLNIGQFQVRALGADLWAHVDGESATVCLHQGALEITSSSGEQRLDFAGDCLQNRNGKPPRFLPGGETELRDRLLAADPGPTNTASAAVASANATMPTDVAIVAIAAKDPKSAPAAESAPHSVPASPVVSAPASAPVSAPALTPVVSKVAVHRTPHWVIVLATTRSRAAADDAAYKLAKRTLRTTVRETGKASQPFSVTFGEFETKKEADQFAQKLRRKYHLKIIRIALAS